MDSARTKAMLLKAGIPLVLSLAGLAYARITSRKKFVCVQKPPLLLENQVNSLEPNSCQESKVEEESTNSAKRLSYQDTSNYDDDDDDDDEEEEILSLTNDVEDLNSAKSLRSQGTCNHQEEEEISSLTNVVEDLNSAKSLKSQDTCNHQEQEEEEEEISSLTNELEDLNLAQSLNSQDTHNYEEEEEAEEEEEILILTNEVEDLQKGEWELEVMFLCYRDFKDKESAALQNLNSTLSSELTRVEAENQKFEIMVVEYMKYFHQLEYLKSENGLLRRKVNNLLRRTREQSSVIRKNNLKMKGREVEILRNHGDIMELKNEVTDLETIRDQLQVEKDELLNKLQVAEKQVSSISKTEAKEKTVEEYKKLSIILEQLPKNRETDVKDLINLRWSNAYSRPELLRLSESCAAAATSTSKAHSKKPKLLNKFKNWVKGSERSKRKLDTNEKQWSKRSGRRPVSFGAEEENLLHEWKTFSSA